MPPQRNIFPVKIERTYPPDINSADCNLFGLGEDGLHYTIKQKDSGAKKHLPLTEWVCSNLASQMNIATPPFELVELMNGELAFGSRWENGLQNDILGVLMDKTRSDFLARLLTKIHFFDLLINNNDRHPGNFLARPIRDGHSQMAVFAFDYSRALLVNPFPPSAQLLDPRCHTMSTWRILKKPHYVSRSAADDCLAKIPNLDLFAILSSAPKSWVEQKTKKDLLAWWNKESLNRANTIHAYLCNDTNIQS